MERYDAILIPGGGVREGGELPPWVRTRFDRALHYWESDYFIPLSAGTYHKPPPLDENGFPIYESIAGARYLLHAGVPEQKILTETCSYDTIGNAFFSRVIHLDHLDVRRVLIITSEFHMPRTKEIFGWVLKLDKPNLSYDLHFESTTDEGLEEDVLEARIRKERESLLKVLVLKREIHSLSSLHTWLFTQHGLYRSGALHKVNFSDPTLKSY